MRLLARAECEATDTVLSDAFAAYRGRGSCGRSNCDGQYAYGRVRNARAVDAGRLREWRLGQWSDDGFLRALPAPRGSDPCHTHLAAARRQMEQDAGEPKRRTAAFRPFFLEKGLKRLELRLRSQT